MWTSLNFRLNVDTLLLLLNDFLIKNIQKINIYKLVLIVPFNNNFNVFFIGKIPISIPSTWFFINHAMDS